MPLSCGFQAPTFRHPRLGPADLLRPQYPSLESWTSVRSGHGCPHPDACVSKVSKARPEFLLAWLPLQSLAVKKKTFFLCKFWAVNNFQNLLKSVGEIFLSGLRGAKQFLVAFRMVFRIFFSRFSNLFLSIQKFFGGNFVLQTCRPKFLFRRFRFPVLDFWLLHKEPLRFEVASLDFPFQGKAKI